MDTYDTYVGWLEEVRRISLLVDKLGETLTLLADKRITLEEKIITSYFLTLMSKYGQLIDTVNSALLKDRKLADTSLPGLRQLNEEVDVVLDDLLKIVKYNLNFLEQYFEFDYANRLTENHRFVERLEAIQQQLPVKS